MTPLLWFFLWLLVAIPSVKIAIRAISRQHVGMGLGIIRFILGIVIGILLILTSTPDYLMWWCLFPWLIGWTLYELISGKEDDSFPFIGTFIVVLVIFLVAIGITAFYSGNNNAIYFDSFIVKEDGFPIQNEIPDNMLRLSTQELAESITSQHMGEFGSAVKVINSHLGLIDGRLYWLSTTAKEEQWHTTFETSGILAVDANDPDKPIKVIKENFDVAQGLDFNPIIGAWGSAPIKGYFGIDTALSYGDAYPVLNPETNTWTTVLTTFKKDIFFVRKYTGLYELNKEGDVIQKYDNTNIPKWIIEPYDENNFLEKGIADWGAHKRGTGFDLWAGGFLWIPPSNDRLAITEDTRYIYDPDSNQIVAMVMVHPIREKGELSLAGAFKVTPQGIFYYDLKSYDLMSGIAASSVVKSKITARASSDYFTRMELLYPLKVGNETKYAWFVPIYYTNPNSNVIGLAGLGIVDAQSADKVIIEYTGEGVTGETLIRKAKESFRNLYGQGKGVVLDSDTIKGTILSKTPPYVKDCNSKQWLLIKTSSGNEEFLIDSAILDDKTLLKANKLQVGETIEFKADNYNIIGLK
ncbi:MAG: hypothetical protein MCSN_2080 [Candidatus Microsyncoccus archaeolyticus]|nr:MAG: hypothetical protein MCSN_2080 [Candidatus Parcubacteria bacterium]